MRHRAQRLVAAAACAIALAGGARGAGAPAESDEALLARASAAFAAGARAAAERPAEARAAMAPAVAGYRELIESRGLHSAGLHYNLGNALYLSNDVGAAILAYRRAQRLDAGVPGLAENLAAARARAGFKGDAGGAAGTGGGGAAALGSAVAWHTVIPAPARLWGAAALMGAFWLVLLARLRGGRGAAPMWLACLCAAAAVMLAGSLWWEVRSERASPSAVVVAERVVGRKGPDELSYQPSFTEPLRAGFEVRVLERRGEWVSVRLGDGRVTWVPASSVEAI